MTTGADAERLFGKHYLVCATDTAAFERNASVEYL